MDQRKLWLWLAGTPKIGWVRFSKILEYYGDLEEAYQKPNRIPFQEFKIDAETGEEIIRRAQSGYIEREIEGLEKKGISFITLVDPGYPRYLREIAQPPLVLYTKGEIGNVERPFAIVGTRRPTRNAISNTIRIAEELSCNGVSIISGMARGIDSAAHTGALKGRSNTIAVLGCGVDIIYPPENTALYEDILEHGAVISEFSPGMQPQAHFFPMRNRIINGVSKGVLLVEGKQNSGGHITVKYAYEEGRDVFALPGDISFAQSALPNALIKDGAEVVLGAKCILEYYGWGTQINQTRKEAVMQLDFIQQQIIEQLSLGDMTLQELVNALNQPTSSINANVTILELMGKIERIPGNRLGLMI